MAATASATQPVRRSSRRSAGTSAAVGAVKPATAATPTESRRTRAPRSIKRETPTAATTAAVPLPTPPATPKRRSASASVSPTKKRVKKEETATPTTIGDRKLALLRSSLATEPFPHWPRPTPEEAQQVALILSNAHGYKQIPRSQPPKGEDRYGGCGDVSDVLDAVVRTVLSCNTSGSNSRAAHKSLCDTFGRCNWPAILAASHADVAASIRCGGLHDNKARTIQGVLQQTIDTFGVLSLNHLHSADARTVMETLVAFKGVGPKVASCVAMFALGKPECAVDTHVQRLCRKLAWVPDKSTRDQTYYHLAKRLPDDLKYGLHVLLIKHGKACAACSARGFATDTSGYTSSQWDTSAVTGDADDDNDDVKPTKQKIKCPLALAGLTGNRRVGSTGKAIKKEDASSLNIKQEEPATPRVKQEDN